MIGRGTRVMKVDQKVRKDPLSHQKNEMLIFGLRSTSDDQSIDLSNES